MRAIDKLKQTKYHLDNMIYFGENILSLPKFVDQVEVINKLRYEFSAYVTSSRSVTFVLQKDLRTKFTDRFDDWYNQQKKSLFTDDKFNQFIKIRNMLEKEGNVIPHIILHALSDQGNLAKLEFDFSQLPGKMLTKYGMNSKTETGLYQGKIKGTNSNLDDMTLHDIIPPDKFEELLSTLFSELESIDFKNYEIKEIRLLEGDVEMSLSEFIAICTQYYATLKTLIFNAKNEFLTASNST